MPDVIKRSSPKMAGKYRSALLFWSIVFGAVFLNGHVAGQGVVVKTHNDSIVSFAKKFIHSADSVASRGHKATRVFAKVGAMGKYVQVNDNNWPDSIVEAITVVYYGDNPVEYIEIPISRDGDVYQENDSYYRKGRLIALKIATSIFKGNCVRQNGAMNERSTWYYDPSGVEIRKEHSLVDANNKEVNNKECFSGSGANYKPYMEFSNIPLVKAGLSPGFKAKTK
jgi:hypothetical protein